MNLALHIRDDSRTPAAFVLSVLLHVTVVGLLVALFIWRPTPTQITPRIIELLAGPPSPDSTSDQSSSSPGDGSLSVPNIAPAPTVAPSPASPAPKVQVQPTPVAPTVVAQPPPPKPATRQSSARRPAATTPAASTRATTDSNITSYSDWIKKHPPATSSAPTRGAPRPVPHVGVNVGNIVNNWQQGGSGAAATTGAGRSGGGQNGTSDDYDARLRKRVYDVFSPPSGYDGLSAAISLTIAADGTVIEKHLTRSSGNDVFDAAVRQALALLRNVDPPPDGQQITRSFVLIPKAP